MATRLISPPVLMPI